MFLVFKQLFILYIFLFAGWVIGKRKKAVSGDILSVLIVNLLLPCKIFNTFANNFTVADFKEKYIFLPVSAVLLLILVIAAYFASKLITKHPYERKIYRYSFAISNYAYLGYALIEGVFGEEMLSNFIFFAIPFIIYTYTAGYAMLTGGKKPLKRLLNPITIAIVLGMICGMTSVKIPDVISSVTSM
ncbi:MAG: AEC family transporter, partial [Clostridia bacterium]|nr:AEC family transporter [Clostridia bacterium]